MAQATVDGIVLAESDATIEVEGNHYFPPDSLNSEHFKPSEHTTFCGWKGHASYYDVVVNGNTLKDAAWYYASPLAKAIHIRDHVAFYKKQVQIEG